MNSKIPFNKFALQLAESAGISAAGAEAFVKEFFILVSDNLLKGERVDIDGIGSFERTDNQDEPVKFTPAPTLAELVNAPFSLFEAEEINPDVTEAMLTEAETETEPEPADNQAEELTDNQEPIDSPEELHDVEESLEVEELIDSQEDEPQAVAVDESEEEVGQEVVQPTPPPFRPPVKEVSPVEEKAEPAVECHSEDIVNKDVAKPAGMGFGMGFLVGILVGIAIGAFGVFMYMSSSLYDQNSRENDSITVQYLEEQLEELESMELSDSTSWPETH